MKAIYARFRSLFDQTIVRRVGLSAFDRHTANTTEVRWLGQKIRQNPFDAWTIQELIVERHVDLVLECGTYEGGLTLFMASLFDLLGRGLIITVDIDEHMTGPHPRIERIMGSSTDLEVVAKVSARVAEIDPRELLIILDSDHSAGHVLAELEAYSDLVPIGGYLVVQDGVVDELRRFREHRPGPLVAIQRFVARNGRFVIDEPVGQIPISLQSERVPAKGSMKARRRMSAGPVLRIAV